MWMNQGGGLPFSLSEEGFIVSDRNHGKLTHLDWILLHISYLFEPESQSKAQGSKNLTAKKILSTPKEHKLPNTAQL